MNELPQRQTNRKDEAEDVCDIANREGEGQAGAGVTEAETYAPSMLSSVALATDGGGRLAIAEGANFRTRRRRSL